MLCLSMLIFNIRGAAIMPLADFIIADAISLPGFQLTLVAGVKLNTLPPSTIRPSLMPPAYASLISPRLQCSRFDTFTLLYIFICQLYFYFICQHTRQPALLFWRRRKARRSLTKYYIAFHFLFIENAPILYYYWYIHIDYYSISLLHIISHFALFSFTFFL